MGYFKFYNKNSDLLHEGEYSQFFFVGEYITLESIENENRIFYKILAIANDYSLNNRTHPFLSFEKIVIIEESRASSMSMCDTARDILREIIQNKENS